MELTGEIPDYVCSFPVVLFKIYNKNHVSGVFFILVSCTVNIHVLKWFVFNRLNENV